MPEEIFDVVNDRDEVIDRRPRSEVHRLGLLHRAVHVLVFNSRGEIFVSEYGAVERVQKFALRSRSSRREEALTDRKSVV